MNTIYQNEGYDNRRDYLSAMAEDYGVDEDIVLGIAGMLGESEDFDGLISALEDANDLY